MLVRKGKTLRDRRDLVLVEDERTSPARYISDKRLSEVFMFAGQKLREGVSSEAEAALRNAIGDYHLPPDDLANLNRLLAFTLETRGDYKGSLEVVKRFDDEEMLNRLSVETQVRVTTQLAISYNNLGDHPKAVTLLKANLEKARANELTHLYGGIENGLARVYRKLNECPICRDHANNALVYYREIGDWLGMAEAYREIALSYHQEGSSQESLEYFDLGIQIIGDRSAPFMLGKLYTDMSGAYWFLRRPKDGIQCLEKSIVFFERTEHILNSVMAYNNLGLNLILVGDWDRAEQMIGRALELAKKSDHVHVAGILDSLGELKILRGDLDEAEDLLLQAVDFAKEKKREWYQVQAMRNLARVYLTQGRIKEAETTSRDTIELSRQIGDKHYANMAGLVLAESLLAKGEVESCEGCLQSIEDSDPSSDFFVLGSIQRIRGLSATENGDKQLALHHLNRSLTNFETAEDLYHSALAHYLIGSTIFGDDPRRAARHLSKAGEIFKKLGVQRYEESAARKTAELRESSATFVERRAKHDSSAAQLLMVRLAEATASRELLFRELVAILQQESQIKKIIIAEANENKKLVPFITHGYAPEDSGEIVSKFDEARQKKEESQFIRSKNCALFTLKPATARQAFVIAQPRSAAELNDGGPLQPLMRVVELGMELIALRERDKTTPITKEASPFSSNSMMPGFIHSSPAMTAVVDEIYKIRSSDVTVLVTGESGTGKELVSRAIQSLSNRKDKIFVPFNCTAVPKELAEGHLFGYKKGSFTGAMTDSPGMIRAADGGTLFLDEIGDLPLDVQPKLLRFLQEGEVQPIGEKRPIKVDVRVIAATNMPLEEKVADGSFREDLYYRLNVIRLHVPPLRERRSEIPPIVNYYLRHYSSRFGKHDVTFTPQTVDLLMVCNWEGNVRQLCNEIQRVVARAVDGEVVTPDHLSPDLRRSSKPITPFFDSDKVRPIATYDSSFVPFNNQQGGSLDEAVADLETQMIKGSLARHNWNISRVAKELGLTRRGLYLKISRYGIERAA